MGIKKESNFIVKCINNKNCNDLTLGREYPVHSVERWSSGFSIYHLINDNGDYCNYPIEHFEIVKDLDNDMVNHPNHYTYKSKECKDIIEVMAEGLEGSQAYYIGAIIKYLYRFPKKNNPIQDLEKAKTYIDMIIEELKGE